MPFPTTIAPDIKHRVSNWSGQDFADLMLYIWDGEYGEIPPQFEDISLEEIEDANSWASFFGATRETTDSSIPVGDKMGDRWRLPSGAAVLISTDGSIVQLPHN